MSRYIDAEAFDVIGCDIPSNVDSQSFIAGMDFMIEKIDEQPTADVRENVHGRWIGGELGHCSVCGCKGCASDIWNYCHEKTYCPNCGAELE